MLWLDEVMTAATAAWQAQLVAVAVGAADPDGVRTPWETRAEFDRQLAAVPRRVDPATSATLRVMGIAA